MKTWKLVSGILSIVLCPVVFLDAFFSGGRLYGQTGSTLGYSGVIISFLMLVAGIISIAVKNDKGYGGYIALLIFYGTGAYGFSHISSVSAIGLWSLWCAVCALIAFIGLCKTDKEKIEK